MEKENQKKKAVRWPAFRFDSLPLHDWRKALDFLLVALMWRGKPVYKVKRKRHIDIKGNTIPNIEAPERTGL